MLTGFLNHGIVIVHDLLLGTSTRVHTVSFPARRARSRRSAGHMTICDTDLPLKSATALVIPPSWGNKV